MAIIYVYMKVPCAFLWTSNYARVSVDSKVYIPAKFESLTAAFLMSAQILAYSPLILSQGSKVLDPGNHIGVRVGHFEFQSLSDEHCKLSPADPRVSWRSLPSSSRALPASVPIPIPSLCSLPIPTWFAPTIWCLDRYTHQSYTVFSKTRTLLFAKILALTAFL
jgi:hypothetical protein